MSKNKNPGGKGGLFTRVKTAKRRSSSSTRWLERQLSDPYVIQANKEGYRSRAAYKLIEINDKFNFLKPKAKVVDLGAAPGSWAQVACKKGCKVVGIDLQTIDEINGAEFIQGDFLDNNVLKVLEEKMSGKKVDVVMSDMAASATGHHSTDHIRIMILCETAIEFALEHLKEGGIFIAKVLVGGAEKELVTKLRLSFREIKHIKPKASRSDSTEMYVVANGFIETNI